MENSKTNGFERPLFTKLGFFTKKGYIIYSIYYLLIDYIFVLYFGIDKQKILLFGIPYTITSVLLYNIAFFGGLYLLSKINDLFGIDFSDSQIIRDNPNPMITPLFTKTGFLDFQNYISERISKKWIPISAGILTVIIVVTGVYSPFILFQGDEWIENFPELGTNEVYYPYLILRIFPYSLTAIWFLFCVISMLFLIVEFMIIFNTLGNFSGLSLSRLSKYLDSNSSSILSDQSEIVRFSIKRFRRRSRIIPELFLKINIGVSVATFIIALLFSVYISNIVLPGAKNFANYFFFTFLSAMMTFNVIVFLFPQYSLHRHLERVKNSFLDKFEEIYEIKKFQYLNFAFVENLEEKNLLLGELQILHQLIVDIEEISTWPFNYNHLTTLIIGLIFPFLPLLFEILFIN